MLNEKLTLVHNLNDTINSYIAERKFVPQELCDNTRLAIDNLISIQKSFESLFQQNKFSMPESVDEAERIINEIEVKNKRTQLIDKLNLMECKLKDDSKILHSLQNELKHDSSGFAINISEALVSDIENGTFTCLQSVAGIENSNYQQLILACMFRRIFFSGSPAPDDDCKGTADDTVEEVPIISPVAEQEVIKEQIIQRDEKYNEYTEFLDNCKLDFHENSDEAIGTPVVDDTEFISKNYGVKQYEKYLIDKKSTKRGARTVVKKGFLNRGIMFVLSEARCIGINAEYLARLIEHEEDVSYFEDCINKLYRRGILSRVSLEGYPDLYFPNKSSEMIYTNEKLRSMIMFDGPKTVPTMYGINYACSKVNRLKSIHIIRKAVCGNIRLKSCGNTSLSTGISEVAKNPYSGISGKNMDLVYIYSYLPQNPEDIIDAYLDSVMLFEDEKNSDASLIVASGQRIYCNELCHLIAESGKKPENFRLYGYSYEENAFYRYGEDETIDPNTEFYHTSESPDEEDIAEENTVVAENVNETVRLDENIIVKDNTEPETAPVEESTVTEEKSVPETAPVVESTVPKEKSEPENNNSEIVIDSSVDFATAKQTVIELLSNGKVYCMLAYLKAVSYKSDELNTLYKCTAYAYDDPMCEEKYSSSDIISLISDGMLLQDGLFCHFAVAAALRNYFSNDSANDYLSQQLMQTLMPYSPSEVNHLAQELVNYKNTAHCGIEAVCDCTVRELKKLNETLIKIGEEAKCCYHNYFEVHKLLKAAGRIQLTYDKIFDKNNELACMLDIVADNKTEEIEFVQSELMQFMKSGNVISENEISDIKIGEYVDIAWKKSYVKGSDSHTSKLMSEVRSNIIMRISRILHPIAHWVRLHLNNISDVTVLSEKQKNDLINRIDSAINVCSAESAKGMETALGMRCVISTLSDIKAKLDSSYSPILRERFFYIDFLRNSYITLVENEKGRYLPDLTNYCRSVKGFDICDRIIAHSKNERNFPEPDDFDCKEKCNIGNLRCLINYCNEIKNEYMINENCTYYIPYSDTMLEGLRKQLEHYSNDSTIEILNRNIKNEHNKFIERLELAQSYGKFDISEDSNIKENIQAQTDDLFSAVISSENYGFYRFALSKIEDYINEQASTRVTELHDRLKALENSIENNDAVTDKEVYRKYYEKVKRYIKATNFTAAEDIINRIAKDDIDKGIDTKYSADILIDFHNQYDNIHRLTKNIGAGLTFNNKCKSDIEAYIKSNSLHRKDVKGGMGLIEKWIKGNRTDNIYIEILLEHLGISASVDEIKDGYGSKKEVNYFDCKLNNSQENKTNYSHIIAPFGSRASETSFRVACLYGDFQKNRIIAEINEMSNYQKNTIIFVDCAYTEKERCEIAKELKRIRSNEIYMIVDRIIITYLAANYLKSAITSQLMSLAMPFSYYQPYVSFSSNIMTPEMFVGRSVELNEIKSEAGINLLYGGRQLGKSELLKKAASEVDGINGEVAIYVDVKESNIADSAKKTSWKFISKGIFNEDEEFTDWEELCHNIEKKVKEKNISKLYLFIDEGDKFISDCSSVKYKPIEELKRLSTEGNIRFKFVIAGLHEIARFDRIGSKSNNSVIPHLKHRTIRPFSFPEAKELLEYPLSTLGIFFRDDEKTDALVSTILANTNYFPGLIHLYCSKVVESLSNDDCPCYSTSDAPPYYVTEAQIQKILANENFTAQIKNKFDITLALGDDCYYDIIAHLMSWLCYDRGIGTGYTVSDILEIGREFGIKRIMDMSADKLSMFVDELVDLNIFRKSGKDRYVFSRRNFMRLMGTQDMVFDKLSSYAD